MCVSNWTLFSSPSPNHQNSKDNNLGITTFAGPAANTHKKIPTAPPQHSENAASAPPKTLEYYQNKWPLKPGVQVHVNSLTNLQDETPNRNLVHGGGIHPLPPLEGTARFSNTLHLGNKESVNRQHLNYIQALNQQKLYPSSTLEKRSSSSSSSNSSASSCSNLINPRKVISQTLPRTAELFEETAYAPAGENHVLTGRQSIRGGKDYPSSDTKYYHTGKDYPSSDTKYYHTGMRPKSVAYDTGDVTPDFNSQGMFFFLTWVYNYFLFETYLKYFVFSYIIMSSKCLYLLIYLYLFASHPCICVKILNFRIIFILFR